MRPQRRPATLALSAEEQEKSYSPDQGSSLTTNGSAGDLHLQAGGPAWKADGKSARFDRYEPSPRDAIRRGIVHYGPENRPLCGEDGDLAQHTAKDFFLDWRDGADGEGSETNYRRGAYRRHRPNHVALDADDGDSDLTQHVRGSGH